MSVARAQGWAMSSNFASDNVYSETSSWMMASAGDWGNPYKVNPYKGQQLTPCLHRMRLVRRDYIL